MDLGDISSGCTKWRKFTAGEAAEGRPEDEAAEVRPEEEAAFWDETAFRNNEKNFSQITYQIQHVHVQIHM